MAMAMAMAMAMLLTAMVAPQAQAFVRPAGLAGGRALKPGVRALQAEGGKGFGKPIKRKPPPKPRGAKPPQGRYSSPSFERSLKLIAGKFVDMKNAGKLDDIFSLCSTDVDMYGTEGLENAKPVLRDFFADHPNLKHEIHGEPVVVRPGTVGYRFVKTWTDKDSGEEMRWASFEEDRNKMETLSIGADGRIVKIAVVGHDIGVFD